MRNERQESRGKKATEKVGMAHIRPDAPWSVANAKARLSEVLDKARDEGPQFISRNGKPAAVVVGIEEWRKKSQRKGTLVDFLMSSPLRGSGIEIERSKDEPRDIDL
jgi:prevent-host-death family protein